MRLRVVFVPALAAVTLLAVSCLRRPFTFNITHVNEDEPQSEALIKLSDPQIYSREALVEDRRREIAFLEGKIDKSESVTFEPEIRRQTRILSTLAGELGIKFDPTTGLAAGQAAEVAELEQRIRMTRLRTQLLSAERALSALESDPAAQGDAGDVGDVENATVSGIGLEEVRKVAAEVQSLADRVETVMDKEIPATRKAETGVSPREEFRDLRAYRAEIRAALEAENLDDTHDRVGNSLYRLQFRATVMPGEHKDQFGVAELTIRAPEVDWEDIEALHRIWLAHMTYRLSRTRVEEGREDLYAYATRLFALEPVFYALDGRDKSLCTREGKKHPDRCGLVRVAIPWDFQKDVKLLLDSKRSEESGEFRILTDGIRDLLEYKKRLDKLAQDEGKDAVLRHCLAFERSARFIDAASILLASLEGYGDRLGVNTGGRGLRALKDRIQQNTRVQNAIQTPFSWGDIENELLLCQDWIREPSQKAWLLKVAALPNDSKKLKPAELVRLAKGLFSASPTTEEKTRTKKLIYVLTKKDKTYLEEPSSWTPYKRPKPWVFAERLVRLVNVEKDAMQAKLSPVWEPCESKGQAFVYATSPAELGQRVSTVSSAADAVQLATALSAIIPGEGIGVDAGLSSLQAAVGQAEAIERAPIVVGYAGRAIDPQPTNDACRRWPDAERPRERLREDQGSQFPELEGLQTSRPRFGWVFGPRAHIEHDGKKSKLVLGHTLTNQPVSVDLSAPGWWPWAEFELTTAWVWNWYARPGLDVLVPSSDSKRFRVALPLNRADLDALTAILLQPDLGGTVRHARIEHVSPASVSACAAVVTFLVYGRDVWRSSRAYLEGLPHKEIRVLPDMEGVAVTFEVSKLPKVLENGEATLTVWTRNGSDARAIKVRSTPPGTGCES